MADWKSLVYRAKGISNGTRVVLLYLAERMQASDRTVSVPRREIAEVLGLPPARVTERIREAREAGFLDTVIAGRPGVTSVYAAMYPTAGGTDGCTSKGSGKGTKKRTPRSGFRGTDGGSPNSEHGEASADERQSSRGGSTTSASARVGESAATENYAAAPEPSDAGLSSVDSSAAASSVTARQRRGETPKGLLLDEIQRCALDHRVSLDLIELLNDAKPGLGDWAEHNWTIPAAAADRYQAGKQLRMLTNTYRQPVSA